MPHDLDMEPSGARLMPLRCIVSERKSNEREGDRNAAVRGVEEFHGGSVVQYNARSGIDLQFDGGGCTGRTYTRPCERG